LLLEEVVVEDLIPMSLLLEVVEELEVVFFVIK